MCRPLALITAAALASFATAQQPLVDPPPFRWTTGAQETGFPFGRSDRQVLRYQEVHDGMDGRPATIAAIALRRSPLDSMPVPAFVADIAMVLSTSANEAATISSTFAENCGPDAVEVLPRRRVRFAASPGVTTVPAPFEYSIPADMPFGFSGGGPLLIELRVFGHSNPAPTRFELYAAGYTHAADVGVGCEGLLMSTQVGTTEVVHTVAGAPAGAPLLVMFGAEFDSMGGTPLPMDLAAVGAPGCFLNLDPTLSVSGTADPSGLFRTSLPIGQTPLGAFYGVQAMASAPGINQLGLVTSNANVVVPVSSRVSGRVWAEDTAATMGLRQPVFGLVIEIRM